MRSSVLLLLGWLLVGAIASASESEVGTDEPAPAAIGESAEPAGEPATQIPVAEVDGPAALEEAAVPAAPAPDASSETGAEPAADSAEATADAGVQTDPAEPGDWEATEPTAAHEDAALETPDAPPAALDASAETAVVDPLVAPLAVEDPAPQLGQIGYDAQGRPGRIHLVVSGDTLWDISDAYLGTAWVWPSIWKDNSDIQNPHLIHPGDRIWITPSEMRRVTPEEAAALLAGAPASEPAAFDELPAASDPGQELPELTAIVPAEGRTVRVSSREESGLIGKDDFESAASLVGKVPDRVMLAEGDRVYIGLGEGATGIGDQYTVFRMKEKVFDPETRRLLGYHVDILGWIQVEEVDGEASLARIRQSSREMHLGDRLMPREPLPTDVSLMESPAGVEGLVSFFAHSRTVMGTIDYVYLNRGTLDGLEVGSPLEIYRDGYLADEPVRGEQVEVPDRVIANLVVVRAEAETAVAYVTHTDTELAVGDRFRGAGR